MPGRAAEVRERLFVQLAPDLLGRLPQYGLGTCARLIRQRHDEQARLAIFSRARIARRRALTVSQPATLHPAAVSKRQLTFGSVGSQLANEPFYGVVAALVAVMLDEALVDDFSVAAFGQLRPR